MMIYCHFQLLLGLLNARHAHLHVMPGAVHGPGVAEELWQTPAETKKFGGELVRNCGKFQSMYRWYSVVSWEATWQILQEIVPVLHHMPLLCSLFTESSISQKLFHPCAKRWTISKKKGPIRKNIMCSYIFWAYCGDDMLVTRTLNLWCHYDTSCTPRFWNGSSETYSNGTLAAKTRVSMCQNAGKPLADSFRLRSSEQWD